MKTPDRSPSDPAPERASAVIDRRRFLGLAVVGAVTVLGGARLADLAGPPSGDGDEARTDVPAGPSAVSTASSAGPRPKVLLAYFSRAGENYADGGRLVLEVGNTEVLAGLIGDRIACDVYRIDPVDPYPESYDETVTRNVEEQEAGARPAIANPLPSIDQYDTILIGSPIWNSRAPMIMSTFAESFSFAGKTVHPFTTHAMSGLGTTERDYARSCPGATIGRGLAVRGEEVESARPQVESWLRDIELT